MKDLREPVSNYPQFDGPGPEVCGEMVNVNIFLYIRNLTEICYYIFHCLSFQKNYTLTKFVFDTTKIPSFMSAGQYKMVQKVYDANDVVVSGTEIQMRLF